MLFFDKAGILWVLFAPDLLHLARAELESAVVARPPQFFAPPRLIEGPPRRILYGHVPPLAGDRVADGDVAKLLRPLRAQASPPIAQVLDEERLVFLDELLDVGRNELGGAGDQVLALKSEGDAGLRQQAECLLCREGGQG